MLYSPRFIAVLDACVLYPAPMRDLLLNLAERELYKPKWTSIIEDEWVRNLLANRKDLSKEKLSRTVRAMNTAFPDALIKDFETFIDSLVLPDKDDRHVLAAAIKGKADVIVTSNIKDFPADYLKLFSIEVQPPDKFISNIIELNQEEAKIALDNQISFLRSPPMSKEQVLGALLKCGLKRSVELLAD